MRFSDLFSLRTAIMLSLVITVSACGGKKEGEFGDIDDEGGTEQEAGGGAKMDPATAGTVTGTVSFEGTAPAPTPIDMSADPVCTTGATPESMSSEEVVVKDGKLANVFVYVSQGLSGTFDAPAEAATLDQQGCRYHPHVMGIMVGQTLKITNSDGTLHNVHPTPQKNKGFNLAQPSKGAVNEVKFDNEEVMIPFSCDVHGWMRSYVAVLPHPAFATSGADGKFSFKAPPGDYTVTAWHEKLGKLDQKVTVGKSETKDITFTFKAQ